MKVLILSIVVLLLSTIIRASSITPMTMFSAPNITKPGCPRQCGNLTVPYPFGVGLGAGCSKGVWYDIFCMTSFDPPKAFLAATSDNDKNAMEILSISETHIRLRNQVSKRCFNSTAETTPFLSDGIDFNLLTPRAPYSVSGTANNLFVVGCQDRPTFYGSFEAARIGILDNGRTSCRTNCSSDANNVVAGQCNGIGCCQASLPKGLRSYTVTNFDSNHTTTTSYNPCGYSFIADKESFKFRGIPDLDDPNFINRTIYDAPLVLDWMIANNTCTNARHDLNSYACKENTTCVDAVDSGIGGYRCSCLSGYEGQPYLTPGCSDINECADLESSPCSMICTNTQGNYTCSCPSGYIGDGKKNGTSCQRQFPALKVGLGVGLGSLSLLITGSWLYMASRNRRLTKMKETFFQRNGGSLLKQLISPNKQDDNVEQVKVFTIDELKVATKNFKDERIVGRGGYGTIYKGFLPNNQIVAVKRSKFVDENQIEQFINELILLARLRHPNVVRLIGCCLEVEVPLLVYEFISNGTVYDHIHNRNGASWYSWSNCLRISMESANALAYIHTIPIFHRDIKSANILLDDSYTAKVSDFGASRLIPLHETHLSTVVQGTLGYLDPEYFFSSQLTAKSDVYSFGVVLCELLTRTKPLLTERQTEEQNQNLATFFIKSMQQDNLFKILDSQLIMEATKEQLISIAKLVERCLRVEGDERPTMKEVAMELGDLWKQTTYLSPDKSST